MNFRRTYSKSTVIRAMVQGVGIGLAAVIMIGLVVFGTGGKGAVEKVPASGPKAEETPAAAEGGGQVMFVKQHGVFSSKEAAAEHIAANPSLANTAVLQAGGQFYVWGAAWLKESDVVLKEGEDAFKKRITIVPGSCKSADAKQVEKVLFTENISETELSADGDGKKKESDIEKKLTAITAFTKDSAIARVHLLAHYSNQDPCVKIQF